MIKAILFDFDGTVADTAPDLGHALNRQRIARGLSPLPITLIRRYRLDHVDYYILVSI
jgi:phosphoglycolate phosphatase